MVRERRFKKYGSRNMIREIWFKNSISPTDYGHLMIVVFLIFQIFWQFFKISCTIFRIFLEVQANLDLRNPIFLLSIFYWFLKRIGENRNSLLLFRENMWWTPEIKRTLTIFLLVWEKWHLCNSKYSFHNLKINFIEFRNIKEIGLACRITSSKMHC